MTTVLLPARQFRVFHDKTIPIPITQAPSTTPPAAPTRPHPISGSTALPTVLHHVLSSAAFRAAFMWPSAALHYQEAHWKPDLSPHVH